MTPNERIARLRELMLAEQLQALIVPTADPHLCETPPEHWRIREWLSGFTGSAGTLGLTLDAAALWVDSRYYLQAEQQLEGTAIELCRDGLPDTPTITCWLADALPAGGVVGLDGRLFSAKRVSELQAELEQYGLALCSHSSCADRVWTANRPCMPNAPAYRHALEYARLSVAEKLSLVRHGLERAGARACLMADLSEVCWAFNLRGADLPYSPLVVAYGYVDMRRALLFVEQGRLSAADVQAFAADGVEVRPYTDIEAFLGGLSRVDDPVAVAPSAVNFSLYKILCNSGVELCEQIAGVASDIKARKTPAELDGIRSAMLNDGAAMAEFLCWLEGNVGRIPMDELTLAQRLLECRQKRQGFVGESFAPIVAYGAHGAIVHYSAKPSSAASIEPAGFLLIDSGGQYLTGTTDLTRTLHLGQPTDEEKLRYTLVLKGMIALSAVQFPHGTSGAQLDTLARQSLWAHGLNYGHGTGHGVGYFLNVHEGSHQIRPTAQMPIEVGMVTSNEPGVYIAGEYGIRIENLLVCHEVERNDFGRFLNFETLTLCPISTKPIARELLTSAERDWLNAYHAEVRRRIAPLVDGEVRQWLERSTQPV